MSDLDAILEGEVTDAPEPVAEVTEAAPEVEAQAGEVTTGEAESSTPEPEVVAKPAEPTTVPLEALIDERQKRQEMQRQLDELQKQPAPQAPDVFEDQGAFADHITQQLSQRLEQQERTFNVELARIKHTDYDDRMTAFVQMAEQNPVLANQAAASGNAPEFAYQYALQQEQVAKLNDPAELERLVQERAEKLLSERQTAEVTQKLDEQPPSLSTQAAARGTSDKPFAPATLENIIG